MEELLKRIKESRVIGIDTETTGLHYPKDMAFCVSIATEGFEYFVDFRTHTRTMMAFIETVEEHRPIIATHNASFDYRMLHRAGFELPIELFQCTSVRACLINEHESTMFPWTRARGDYRLETLSQKYLGASKDEQFLIEAREELGLPKNAAKHVVMGRLKELSVPLVARYCNIDARLALLLWQWQTNEIEKQGIWDIINFEQSLTPTIVRSEMRGIDVSIDRTEQAITKMDEQVDQAQAEIDKMAGAAINTNSPKQIREFFNPKETKAGWVVDDKFIVPKTKSGAPSFGSGVLRDMGDPRADKIVELRSLIKTRDTFLKSHILAHAIDGKVYPNINQAKGEDGGTGTGRLSYTDPAMQQIPSRNKKIAAIVKPCFLPPEGMLWLETDLASFEVRVFAHLVAAYNDSLVQAYVRNPQLDFHQWVADLTGLVRDAQYSGQPNSKQLNLSMIFNQGKGATAQKMGMEWSWDSFTNKKGEKIVYKKAGEEAEAIINKYHSKVKGVKTLADRAKKVAEDKGQIKTAFGRRLRFPKGYKAYKASGLLIQATAADINKRNWMVVEQALGNDGHLILNTHDSYSMAVPMDWEPYFKNVRDAIQDMSDLNFRVPLLLDLDGAGHDWWSAKCGEFKCS